MTSSYTKVSARPDWSTMSKAKTDQYIEEHTHCSALVRATPDLSEIYFSHVTWCEYVRQSMTHHVRQYL